MLTLAAPTLIGFLVTTTMMLALRPVAAQLGLVDIPGGRKTHLGRVPVIGGIAIFLGLVAAVVAMDGFGRGESPMLVGAGVMVSIGALDDRFDLPPNVRILAHLAAVMTMVLASGYRVENLGNLLGSGPLELGSLAFVFTVVAAIALINGFNMLDGLDGLAGGVALVGLCGLAAIALIDAVHLWDGLLVVALGLVGSVGAFLIFNVPASFNRGVLGFMGDAGSTLLGFVLAGLALIAIQPSGPQLPPVIVLWLLPVPILELFTSTFRRIWTGLSPMQADRGHFHYRLLDAGFSVRAIFVLYLSVSSASAVAGIVAWRLGVPEPVMFYSFVVLCGAWVVAVRHAPRLARLLPRTTETVKATPDPRGVDASNVGR
jgi:UDP-GlcNAc:undecaprenyl-phosphate GlcNAc-1-phosphate transferase